MKFFSSINATALCVALQGVALGADDFQTAILPLLKEQCNSCHSTKKKKGDLDLERFTSVADIKREPMIWEGVLDQIHMGEMPPKKEPQFSTEQKTLLTKWVQDRLEEVALASAGDPGPVVLRRLSNMEYTYTLRDLTGVESLDPAKEFPVDGAAGEGFTNVGAALVMSPALLSKYLDAAKDIANHAVLTPRGFRFSPRTSQRDWTDEALAKIRAFYAQFSASGTGSKVQAQGINLDTGDSGTLPLEQYLAAMRDDQLAAKLNSKYLGKLRAALEGNEPNFILDLVRQQWRTGASPAQMAETIAQWQKALWRFSSIGHIGKLNGPKSWQVPVLPLTASEVLRVRLPASGASKLHLVSFAIGQASAIWENARLVKPGQKDLPITIKGDEAVMPVDIGKEAEFVINVRLHPGSLGAVQVRVMTAKPVPPPALVASKVTINKPGKKGTWSDGEKPLSFDAPILVGDDSEMRKRLTAQIAAFRGLFPAALCYTKIVPADEVVTLTLFYREDEQLKRLMLNKEQSAEIDHLWDELRFISESPLKQVDVFEQLWQFATQDADPKAFEPLREPIYRDAELFKQQLRAAEPEHVQAALDFAGRAWRRTLSDAEKAELRSLYQKLRKQDLSHASALRMLIARVLVAPAFLYRGEKASPGIKSALVNDWEIATRLSYFLWSSMPDEGIHKLAAAGKLHDPAVLAAQARRMLKDDKIRRLATEFGCQWLHVRDVETLDEKSERHFPTFISLRGDMQEEVVRFFIDLFQNDRSVLSLLSANHTFVNASLAKHYALDLKGDDWQRLEGIQSQGRGGILGFAATLAKQSGASRTSAILRGTWLSEVILGDKLPIPPKGVPILPEEAPANLSERQLIERHSRDENCAGCHRRIDPFGFALEGFDAIGRARKADTKTVLPDGTSVDGLNDLRDYLVNKRGDDFIRQFCRKLLGYALGRSVQLSDRPLIDSMIRSDHRIGTLIELIVLSPQFREVRGKDTIAQQ
ncbi:MAG: hypothetical protein B7Z37_07375 [Verrucomicrobia bacterium 12-59-8]|nr:MAG: hypothetical protein B7Z37_07375 [Verrucomicrobia bacterium 12-59-8]